MPRPRADTRQRCLGQHFLASREVLGKIIAAAAPQAEDVVLEVGPGSGALTRALAPRVRRMVAVEKDRLLCGSLREALEREGMANVSLVCGDILRLYPDALNLPARFRVVANIPYYLTSRLIRILLEREPRPKMIHLMVQHEVAERIVASPPKMNLLALAVQLYGTPVICFRVPPSAFSPQPNVASAFIAITAIGKFRGSRRDEKTFFTVLRAAFQAKRKTMENSLAQNLGRSKSLVAAILRQHRLAGRRPESVTIAEWVALARDLTPLVNDRDHSHG